MCDRALREPAAAWPASVSFATLAIRKIYVPMPDPMIQSALQPAPLRIDYEAARAADLLAQSDVLAVIGFGPEVTLADDPRTLRVGLTPLGPPRFEVWRATGPVQTGRTGDLRWSRDDEYLFFAIELDEAVHGGITAAAEHAYRCITRFVASSATPHLLRMWNYFDAINLGDGDQERYRLFCEGRALAMQAVAQTHFPAATAIGRQDGVRVLQVYGVASRHPGRPVENPRQVSAWRYPRQYGPTAPTFARGMLTDASQLLISGTAAVVGHASTHRDDLSAQISEMLANLDSLVRASGSSQFGAESFLKAYLRCPRDAAGVAQRLRAAMPAMRDVLLLAGDICRGELLIEVDGVQPLAKSATR
jgi:chorismate lyase/3-hydroxybenzoate synthase